MADTDEAAKSHGFIKGVKRASFTAVEPQEPATTVTAQPAIPGAAASEAVTPPPQPQPAPQPTEAAPHQIEEPHPSVQSVIQETFVKPVTPPPAPAPAVAPPHKKRAIGPILLVCGIVVFAGLAAYSFWMYYSSQQELARVQQKTVQARGGDAATIIASVKDHMVLPNETPTVTTVTNADAVRSQPFYANAQNGDRVLVFKTRAILYRPSIDRIIEVGYIIPTPGSPTATASGQLSATASGKLSSPTGKK